MLNTERQFFSIEHLFVYLYQAFLGYFRNIVFSYSIEYELFMGLILGYTEKEKRSNLLVFNLLERLFCGERGIRTPGASQHAGFQDRCNRPLYHLSIHWGNKVLFRMRVQRYNIFFIPPSFYAKKMADCVIFAHWRALWLHCHA